MKKIALILLMVLGLSASDEKLVVYDLTAGDLNTFEQKILSGIPRHKNYYEGKLETLKVSVIVHGNAYKFFVNDLTKSPYSKESELIKAQANLHKRIQSLVEHYDVEFLVCQFGAEHRKIEKNIYDFIGFSPSAAVGLIEKGNEGYAYLPVN